MVKARHRRRYLALARYANRCRKIAGRDGYPYGPTALHRAIKHVYRNGATLPYGWQPR